MPAMASQPPDETKLAETGFQSGGTPVSGGSSPGSRPGWLSSSSASGSHEAIPPGTLLAERYRILGLAGRGGMRIARSRAIGTPNHVGAYRNAKRTIRS